MSPRWNVRKGPPNAETISGRFSKTGPLRPADNCGKHMQDLGQVNVGERAIDEGESGGKS